MQEPDVPDEPEVANFERGPLRPMPEPGLALSEPEPAVLRHYEVRFFLFLKMLSKKLSPFAQRFSAVQMRVHSSD